MKTPQTMKEKLIAIAGFILFFSVFTGTVYAFTSPSDRETQFIELGRMKEHQVALSSTANEKRAEIESLQLEIDALGQEWNTTAQNVSNLEAKLFQ
jgi:hypothetical protein